MIYSNILNPKFRNPLRVFVVILISIFSLSLYSCQTTWTESYSPEKLKADNDYKILDVTTNGDSTINLTDYDAKYYEKFNETKDVILWEKTDTVIVKTEYPKKYKLMNKVSTINLRDVLYAHVEKEKTDVSKVLLYTGLGVTAVVLVYLAILAITISSFNNTVINLSRP